MKMRERDWRAVHERLEAVRAAAERAWVPGEEDARRILRDRALRLARAPEAEPDSREMLTLVEFVLAHETYGIEASFVRGVQPLAELTPLPSVPSFVLGIVNLRGEVLSVVDLRQFFDLPARGLTDLNKVLVLQSGAMRFGVLADAVRDLRHVAACDIRQPPATLARIRQKYLRGVTEERLIVLDAEKLILDEALIVDQSTDSPAAL